MTDVVDTPAMASVSASAQFSSRDRKSVRSFDVASVERLRGELTGSRCLRYATITAAIRPCGLAAAAPVPPFTTARSGGDSAAVVLPPKSPPPAGFLASGSVRGRCEHTFVRPLE